MTGSFYLASEATTWFRKEPDRFRDFVARSASRYTPEVQTALQDGGELLDNPLAVMPAEVWDYFQEEFLR